MNHILILVTVIFFSFTALAQEQTKKLTLTDIIDQATKQSIDAFKQQNMYLASYYAFKYYRADKLPFLSVGANPFSYNNSIRQDYVPQNQTWQYSEQKNITSSTSLKLNQNIALTGGNLSLSSDLGMARNFFGSKLTTFSANTIGIGYTQRVNGYNSMRWKSKIEPLRFDMAKKGFIQSKEDISIKATSKFFTLVDAQIEIKIAKTNLANSDTLYQIGKGRYQVGTVTQDELLNFELNLMNAKLALIKANQGLVRARSDLNSFLGFDKKTVVECVIPTTISKNLQIGTDEAIQKSMSNNPNIISQNERLLEEDNNVSLVKAKNGLSADISVSAGLNQTGLAVSNAYQNPNKFQNIAIVGLSVPIIDWGKRRGQILMAKSNREVVVNSIKQERIDFEQSVVMNVMEFNLQANQVLNSARADTIAQLGFDVTMRRFKIGKLDVTKLNLARNDLENARRAYISSLRKYWISYYLIRELTLHDFERGVDLSADFDKIINQ
jgi:outer membrane protein TolC